MLELLKTVALESHPLFLLSNTLLDISFQIRYS